MVKAWGLSPLLMLVACGEADVGVPCLMQGLQPGSMVSVAVDAHDCRSRLCLYYGGTEHARPLCTRLCENDSDCEGITGVCPQGFVCAYAKARGAAGCCKLCVCRGYLVGEPALLQAYCRDNPNPSCPGL